MYLQVSNFYLLLGGISNLVLPSSFRPRQTIRDQDQQRLAKCKESTFVVFLFQMPAREFSLVSVSSIDMSIHYAKSPGASLRPEQTDYSATLPMP
jgi:hypothetical protein